MAKKPTKMRTIKYRAYAVIQPDMLKDMPIAMIFNKWPDDSFFSLATFSHEYAAEKVATRYAPLKVKIVQCVVSFKTADRRRKSK